MIAATAALLPGWVWISIAGLTLTVGDIVLRFYFETPKNSLFMAGVLAYCIGALLLAFGYFDKSILVATVAYIALNIVTYALVSIFYFGDTYSMLEILGILFGVIAVVILELA